MILRGGAWLRRPVVAGAALAVLGLVGAGLYGTLRILSNPGANACRAAGPRLDAMRPLARGEVAAFEVAAAAQPVVDLAWENWDGRRVSLSDLRGRTVLLNLWATWCVPCKEEMPALDRLQARLGGERFEVVAVNIDTRNLDRPRAWLKDAGINNLAYHSDREAKIFQDLRKTGDAQGMPTTLLIDGEGCRLGRLAGPAAWDGADAETLIKAAL